MLITSFVECAEETCRFVAFRYKPDTQETIALEHFVSAKLVEWFGTGVVVTDADTEPLRFSVLSVSEAMELYPSADSDDTVFLALLSFCGCLALFGFAACLFNKCRCADSTYSVDEARWTAIIAFALQVWDFGMLVQPLPSFSFALLR